MLKINKKYLNSICNDIINVVLNQIQIITPLLCMTRARGGFRKMGTDPLVCLTFLHFLKQIVVCWHLNRPDVLVLTNQKKMIMQICSFNIDIIKY